MSKKLIVFVDDDEIEEFYGDDLTVELDGENSNSIGNPILKVKKGYNYIDQFRGKLSQQENANQNVYERIQFMKYFSEYK